MEVEEPYCLVKPNGAIHLYDPQTGFVSEDVSPKAAAGHSPFEGQANHYNKCSGAIRDIICYRSLDTSFSSSYFECMNGFSRQDVVNWAP